MCADVAGGCCFFSNNKANIKKKKVRIYLWDRASKSSSSTRSMLAFNFAMMVEVEEIPSILSMIVIWDLCNATRAKNGYDVADNTWLTRIKIMKVKSNIKTYLETIQLQLYCLPKLTHSCWIKSPRIQLNEAFL